MAKRTSKFLKGRRIDPAPITPTTTLAELVDEAFIAYNGARLREACQLFTQKMLEPEVTVGLSLTGALTPAGLGISALIPLIKAGFVDWIISTGANLYHDTHFGIGLSMHQGRSDISDIILREEEVVRIYDIFFDYSVLLDTDAFFRRIISVRSFRRRCPPPSFVTSPAVMYTSASASWASKISRCLRSPTSMPYQSTLHLQAILLSA